MNKIILFSCIFALLALETNAQKLRGIDKSPMDMAYYPDNFAHDRKFAPKLIGDMPAIVRVIYSRPAKKEREIFGTKMVPYGEVWRLGANESTEIKFYQDVTIQGKTVKAGTYSLFAIPTATEWTLVLNKDLDFWGAYSYNAANDVLRVSVPTKKTDGVVEDFSIQIVNAGEKQATMKMAWDMTMVEVPIGF
jgi:hypothetical protein